MKPAKPVIVVVHWLDAAGDRNDVLDTDTGEALRAIHCLTIGVLIELVPGKKRGYIKVASELIEGDEYQEVQAIPNGMILSIKKLPLPLPKEFVGWKPEKATVPK